MLAIATNAAGLNSATLKTRSNCFLIDEVLLNLRTKGSIPESDERRTWSKE